ncbi:pilus assembly protein Flp/PilA [Novosphingobium chloroacetimidivorans]|uniref:Pilus assembly protein Flp/PilA n=1 Tax=Novosphingobium chloroacetimidivorans TaxID=1428314 RepID=A0A7W7K8D3_9SPHN|nr:Flp family type IVb pilin [Novosphingobium chloroacetimidivorans]MBB4858115.1 pilus assembly protein Flp/PilA [Novosphingobium chloroacetimidivorans]
MQFLKSLRSDKKGATAIEYGLIAALIAVAAITAMAGLGSSLTSTFTKTSSTLQNNNG